MIRNDLISIELKRISIIKSAHLNTKKSLKLSNQFEFVLSWNGEIIILAHGQFDCYKMYDLAHIFRLKQLLQLTLFEFMTVMKRLTYFSIQFINRKHLSHSC